MSAAGRPPMCVTLFTECVFGGERRGEREEDLTLCVRAAGLRLLWEPQLI